MIEIVFALAAASSTPKPCELLVDLSKLDRRSEINIEEVTFVDLAKGNGSVHVVRRPGNSHRYAVLGHGLSCAKYLMNFLGPSSQIESSYIGMSIQKIK